LIGDFWGAKNQQATHFQCQVWGMPVFSWKSIAF